VTQLSEQLGPKLLRFKAVVPVNDQSDPLVVHAVQHVVHTIAPLTTQIPGDSLARLVVITDGVPAEEIEQWVSQFDSRQ